MNRHKLQATIAFFGVSILSIIPCFIPASSATDVPPDWLTADIQFSNGAKTMDMPVAMTNTQKEIGLSGASDISHGMLFIWKEPDNRYFWMKGTPHPLSIAFFDQDYRITAIERMEPNTLTIHASPGPALGALELPQGRFQALGATPGMQITITPSPQEPH